MSRLTAIRAALAWLDDRFLDEAQAAKDEVDAVEAALAAAEELFASDFDHPLRSHSGYDPQTSDPDFDDRHVHAGPPRALLEALREKLAALRSGKVEHGR